MKKFVEFLIVFITGLGLLGLSFVVGEGARAWLFTVGVVLMLLAVGYLFYKSGKSEPVREDYKYRLKPSLMSEIERVLYANLLSTVGREYEVFPQIALVSLVDKVSSGAYRNELFRIVDFALCDRRNGKPVLVIELNDASHNRSDRRERDEKVRCILERAGLPLLVLTPEEISSPDLRNKVIKAIKR